MTDTLDGPAVTAAADLGREAAYARPVKLETGEAIDTTLLARLDSDGDVVITDLEPWLTEPRHARGGAAMHDAASFARYVTRLVGTSATELNAGRASMWADDQARRVTCVFNDHLDVTAPGWRDLRATLTVRVDADWERWTKNNNQLLGQMTFGEFLQDMAHCIVDPPAAQLVQTAMTFTAKKNVEFETAARLDTGDVQLVYREDTKTTAPKGTIEVPSQIVVRTPVFYGEQPIDIAARIRYRIGQDGLRIGYTLQRPDIAEREAFDAILEVIHTNTPGVELLLGTAPDALRR